MRTSLFLGTALSVFLLSGLASAAQINFTGTIDSAQEVTPPTVPSTGTGTVDATYDTDKKKLCIVVTYQGLTSAVTNAHIHTGKPKGTGAVGEDVGPPVINFTAPFDSPLADVFDITDAALQAKFQNIATGPMYVNLHTAMNEAGEVRGQLGEGGKGVDCNDEPTDAGTSSGSSGTSSGSSGTSGATTTPSDGGTSSSSGGSSGDSSSSCNTTNSSPLSTGGPILLGLALAGAVASRARRKK